LANILAKFEDPVTSTSPSTMAAAAEERPRANLRLDVLMLWKRKDSFVVSFR